MKIAFILIAVCTVSTLVFAASTDKQCSITKCEAGTKVKSYAKKDDFYFACPTMELSEYVTHVLGITSLSVQVTGHGVNVSPATGDPEQEGQAKVIMDTLRMKAKVGTFDQAIAMCEKGKNGLIFIVANNPANHRSIWVYDEKRRLNVWVPKSHVDKQ